MHPLRQRLLNTAASLGSKPEVKIVPLPALMEHVEERAAVRAFERDMQPVCKAVVEALQAGDRAALEGLRAMLPHLLEDVNRSPRLASALTKLLGREVLAGLAGEEEPQS